MKKLEDEIIDSIVEDNGDGVLSVDSVNDVNEELRVQEFNSFSIESYKGNLNTSVKYSMS